ncbi:NUDIX domain-containing protein [Corynebacterium sp. sy039]|uniref:NUDIX hydrolase n=1 Tax=Corynebacterium sp. sy039 TaxID=2599641 RepID=UPI0011B669C0|nr:NUDIX domain-containing protein [Corynebacterium sp. sy039]QDZ42314.1 NUDIX domain-containing protein [Corynebacterium sp. sy039]
MLNDADLDQEKVIRIAAVVLRNVQGQVLSVRKNNTASFMLPGGKREQHESAQETAIREIWEELRLELDPSRLQALGSFCAPAANEDGYVVQCELFDYSPAVAVTEVFAELAEFCWFDLASEAAYSQSVAPLSKDVVFPFLTQL